MKTRKKQLSQKENIEYILILGIILLSFLMITHEFGLNPIIIILAIFFVGIATFLHIKQKDIDLIERIVQYRYPLLLCVFVICVFCKLSGSSIAIYNNTLTEKIDDNTSSVLFGKAREIRGDEHTVLTPYYLSQTYNNFQKYSNSMSLSGQNMIIGYNAPVYDITMLAKPLNWGYMLLGNEYGLSWYWCLKLILIILSAFEVLYIITGKNKELSIVGAVMIAWGPSTQWWFAPHMPDVILWSMCLLAALYHFLNNEKEWVRNILTVILPFIALEFVIALFPSFQVGLGYFIGIVFIALLYRDKINPFKGKRQNIRNAIMIVLTCGLLGFFLATNYQDLKAVSNTVYPGHRTVLGGNYTLKDTFTDLSTMFLGYTEKAPYTNASEDSTYIHFGIFFLFLMPLLVKELKAQKDRTWIIGMAISIFMGIQLIFMLFGFPEIISKITLFSYINRMKMIFGLVSVIFTIWGIDALLKTKHKINSSYYLLAVCAYCLLYFSFIDGALKLYLPVYFYYVEIIIFASILCCLYWNYKKVGISLLLSCVLVSSIPINPIITGVSDIYNHPSAKEISKIAKENNHYWIGYGNFVLTSYLLANGANTLNAVNFYPDLEKWKIIDPDEKYTDVYNRYCHIFTILSNDGEDHISKTNSEDIIKLEMTLETMVNLNIEYILANVDLGNYKEKEYMLKEIYQDTDVRIYQIFKNVKER